MGPPQLVNIKVVWRVAPDRARARDERPRLSSLSSRDARSRESTALCPTKAKDKAAPRRTSTDFVALRRVRTFVWWFFNELQGKSRDVPVISPGSYDLALSNDTLHFAPYASCASRTMVFTVDSRWMILRHLYFIDEFFLNMRMISFL